MLDLIDPPGSHHWLHLMSRNYIPNIILHDGMILFHHGILPNLLAYFLPNRERGMGRRKGFH
jgi:hypothetical protein